MGLKGWIGATGPSAHAPTILSRPCTRCLPVKVFGTDLGALALTLAIGAAGGSAAAMLHLPLGFLIGSLLATAILAVRDIRPFGKAVTLPLRLRFCFVPVIGVAIGGAFTPDVWREAAGWGPSLLLLLIFVPLAHAISYGLYRRGGIGRTEALFGAVPGGLIETVEMTEEAGGDVRVVTVLQFLRLILTILSVPLIFLILTGHAVGSASGVRLAGAAIPLTPRDVGLMVLAGGIGARLAKWLRFPGWIITGPICASGLLHAAGWLQAIPPGWLIAATQVVLGTGLGARFAGIDPALLRRAGQLAVINGVVILTLAFLFALGVGPLVGVPVSAAFLAYAPGGLAEMSVIALSLNMSTIFVSAHHVARIALSVLVARIAARRVGL